MPASTRHRNRLAAWLALGAMLAFALVPTLSRALGSAIPGAAWAEVCTSAAAGGVPGGGDAGPAGPTVHPDRCILCALAAVGLPPPPAAAGLPALYRGTAEAPHVHPPAARHRHAGFRAQPRGPPAQA